MSIERRLEELGLQLPAVAKPAGLYKPALLVDNTCYLSGHLPLDNEGQLIKGRVGLDLDVDTAALAARRIGLTLLATLRAELGSLDRIDRLVKLLGLVNSGPEFHQHPAVINGCSQLFADVLGNDKGVGTRSAFGASALPLNAAVEIEAVFSVRT